MFFFFRSEIRTVCQTHLKVPFNMCLVKVKTSELFPFNLLHSLKVIELHITFLQRTAFFFLVPATGILSVTFYLWY